MIQRHRNADRVIRFRSPESSAIKDFPSAFPGGGVVGNRQSGESRRGSIRGAQGSDMSDLRKIIRTTSVISFLTLGSRLVGLAREMTFAGFFAVGEVLSAFRIAFMIPNLTRRLFGEGALSSSLIPILTDVLHRDGELAARKLAGGIITLTACFLTALTLVGEAAILIAMYFTDEPALTLVAIMLPYMVLICTTAVEGGVLNVRGSFTPPAAAPVVMNVAIIAGTWAAARWLGLTGRPLIMASCLSALASGVIQVAWQTYALHAIRFVPIYRWAWNDPDVRRVMKLMGPMVLGLSAVQISSLVDYVLAYAVVVSPSSGRIGPAVLGYAQYLYQLPLGVFGIALATAIFPVLSAQVSREDRRGVCEVFTRGVRLSLFIGLPAGAGMVLIAVPMVRVLFERGAFGPEQTQRVAGAVMFYALGVPAYCAQHMIVRTFYALKDSATPVRIAAMVVSLNFLLSLILVLTPMQERGIALATALTSMLQVVLLVARLRHRLLEISWRGLGAGLGRMGVATGVMAAALLLAARIPWVRSVYAASPFVELLVQLTLGVITYGSAAAALRIEEVRAVVGLGGRSSSPLTTGNKGA